MSHRFVVRRILLALIFSVIGAAQAVQAEPDFSGFAEWLVKTAAEAEQRGISKEVVEAAFAHLEPDPRVISFDQRQPEFVQTFEQYLATRLSAERVRSARAHILSDQELLSRIAAHYGVEAEFIVAFWGLESSFGRYQGKYSVIRSLATLGFDPRRSRFFTEQLFNALRILEEGHVPPDEFVGGWAGAMGQNQFMPSSFLAYAADFDGDGRKNIWSSKADVFASIANYLKKNGWRERVGWGALVDIPENLDLASLTIERTQTGCRAHRSHTKQLVPAGWRALGIETSKTLKEEQDYALILPSQGEDQGYLVGGNFDVILDYNCANKYAVSVGLLADKIVEGNPGH